MKNNSGPPKVLFHASNGVSVHQFCLPLIRELQQRGCQVAAIARADDFFPLLRKAGITVHDSKTSEDGMGPASLVRYQANLWKIFRSERPALFHCMSPKAIIFSTILARLSGARVVCSLTGIGYAFTLPALHPLRIIVTMLYRIVLPWAHEIILINRDDFAYFRKRRMAPRRKMRLIRSSGVDTARYPKKTTPFPKTVSFIFIGRLLLSKGILYLLQAAAELVRQDCEFSLTIVGSNTYGNAQTISDETLTSYAGKLGTHLRCVGAVTDVRPYLAASSVLVLPTYYREGVPQSILEAMATGLAVITTDSHGSRETIIEERNGILVPPHDVPALTAAMRRFIDQPDLAATMGQAARDLVVEHFSADMVNKQTIETYQRIGLEFPNP